MTEKYFEEMAICYRSNSFVSGRETLVFVHGLSGSLSAWRLYEKRFENSYNVLTYDIRGHGKSSKPREYAAYSIPHFARDLAALLTYLNIRECILISHSFGTLIAFEFLHTYPGKVTKAVFLSPSVRPEANTMSRLVRPLIVIGTLLVRVFPFSNRIGRHLDYSEFPNTTDWNIPVTWANIRNTSLRVYLFCSLQSYDFDASSYIQDISIPVLLMHGARDSIFPVESTIAAQTRFPNAKLIVLPDIDHILVLNRFPQVSESIDSFVRE